MTTPITTEPEYSTYRELRHRLEHHFAQNFDSLAYPLLADIYLAEGDLARARKVCTVGLDHHPGHPPGLFLLATVALRGDNLEDAETLLLQTLSSDEYHLEAAELLVAVQERLRRKKSILEQAYRRLLHANPLSRGALSRLKRLQAERELVRGVKDELKAKRGAPTGSEMEDAQADELQTIEPAEPIREMWAELEAEAAGPVEAPAAGEPTIELPEVDEAEQTWEANIKRLAAMMAASSSRQEEVKPGVTPLKPEAAVGEAKPVETEAPPTEAAAPLLQEPGAGMEPQCETLDTLEAEEKIDEAPGEPGFGPAEEETGPEGEVLDTLALAGEGEVAGSFVSGIAARGDEAGQVVESPFAVIPEGEKPEDEPFKPEARPLWGDTAALEDEFADEATMEDLAQQEKPFQLDVESLPREAEHEGELVEVGPLEGLPLEDKGTGPIGEVPDSESLLEGEPEAEGGDVEVPPAESRAEEREAFEPGVRHLKESGPPAEDIDTVPVDGSAEEEELFEPGVAIASEEAQPVEDDLGTGLPDEQQAAEEQAWPEAAPTDEGTTGPEAGPGAPPLQNEGDEEDLYKIEEADKDTGKEPFEPGTEPDREEGVKPGDEGVDARAFDERKQEEPYRPDVESLQREAEHEGELVDAGPLEGLPLEDKDTGPIGEVPDSESLLEGEPEAEGGDVEVPPAESRAEEREAFEPGARHLKESEPPAEDIDTVPVDGSAEEEELFEPGDVAASEEISPVEEDLGTCLPDEQQAVEEQVWPGAAPTDEGTTGSESVPGEGTAEGERPAEELFEPGTEPDREEEVKPESDVTDTAALESRERQEEPYRPDVESLQRAAKRENELIEAVALAGEDTVDDRPGAPPLQKEGDEEDLYKIEEADKDTGKEPFEPGTEPDREEEVKPGDEGVDARAFDERKQEEPYRPDVESLQRAAKHENELIEAVALAGKDTVDDRPGAPLLQKEGDEEDLYKIEEADKDTGKEPFEPGTEPDREEGFKPGDEGVDTRAFDERKQEEPYRPYVGSLQRETEREDELARAATLEGQDLEDEDAVPFEEITDSESLLEGEPEAEGGDVEVPPAESRAEEREAFEPGARHLKESGPPAEDIDTVPVNGSAEEEELFEPGDVAASEEVPPVEEDLGTGLPYEQQAAKEQVWLGAVPADEGIAGPEAGPGEGTAERERPAEELFEPGAEPAREEEIAAGEKDLDTAATESEDTGEEPAWPDVSPPLEEAAPESVPFVEAALEEKDLAEEQALPGEETDGGLTTLEDEAAGRVTLEDKDLEREPFEPGDQPLDEGDEAELGEAALEEQAVEGEPREEEPYRPDVDSLQKEAEQELEIIDRAAHDGKDMPGELFEPSVTSQKEEALSEPTHEQDQPAAEEAEPDIEELDEGEYEFESEFQAAEEADSRDALGIDPKLATFTLATIYKVQGLYHQALQVLDLLEAKGGDPERIQAERETILQLMTTGTSLEPE